jgi:hypothetical protein
MNEKESVNKISNWYYWRRLSRKKVFRSNKRTMEDYTRDTINAYCRNESSCVMYDIHEFTKNFNDYEDVPFKITPRLIRKFYNDTRIPWVTRDRYHPDGELTKLLL